MQDLVARPGTFASTVWLGFASVVVCPPFGPDVAIGIISGHIIPIRALKRRLHLSGKELTSLLGPGT